MASMRSRRLALALLLTIGAGCAHVEATRLRIRCCIERDNPDGTCDETHYAPVLLDEAAAGTCQDWGGEGRVTTAGGHQIHVNAGAARDPCCMSHDLYVEVPAGKRTDVSVYLSTYPD
jgi:hypothetical protein